MIEAQCVSTLAINAKSEKTDWSAGRFPACMSVTAQKRPPLQ